MLNIFYKQKSCDFGIQQSKISSRHTNVYMTPKICQNHADPWLIWDQETND